MRAKGIPNRSVNILERCLTGLVSAWVRAMLGIYFRQIEFFHPERVPARGPVLFASNHPGSVTDAFIIGTSIQRQVHFVATVRLFRLKPLAWLLTQCGIIPVNRMKDDPRAMRSVKDTFEACFKVLERGGAVGIFPEGITYDDAQLKTVKTGAARMALELEHRHTGNLGLLILPVGITYSAKERYRSEVLVHFGEPIRVAPFLHGYEPRRKECIHELSTEIERRLQSLIVHLPKLEHERVVDGVKRLYLERLKLGNIIVKEPLTPGAEELVLTQAIANAAEWVELNHPDRFNAFTRKLRQYERWCARLSLGENHSGSFDVEGGSLARILWRAMIAIVGAPIALYGWVHRLLPIALIRWVATRFTDPAARKAQTPHASMLTGLISFGVLYFAYVWLAHSWFGWPATFWYALSLPVSGLIAHYYLRELHRLTTALRTAIILARAPLSAKRLARMHSSLVSEIEALRKEYRESLTEGPVFP